MFLALIRPKVLDHSSIKPLIATVVDYKFIQLNADNRHSILSKQQFLQHLVSKFYSGCLQEVMFGISYSYCKVNHSTNHFGIITEDF